MHSFSFLYIRDIFFKGRNSNVGKEIDLCIIVVDLAPSLGVEGYLFKCFVSNKIWTNSWFLAL